MKKEITEKEFEALEKVTTVRDCRLSVIRFAQRMEMLLRENDYKGGWDSCTIEYLNNRLTQEYGEYFANYENLSKTQRRDELTDIANFCMMLCERL